MSNPTQSARDIAATLAQAKDDVASRAAEGAQQVVDATSRNASRLGDTARGWWQRQSEMAHDAALVARNEAREFSDLTQNYVKSEPVKALLVATAVGAVIGGLALLIFNNKRRDR